MKVLKRITLLLIFVFMMTIETSHISSAVGLPVGGRILIYDPVCTVGAYANVVVIGAGVGSGTWMYAIEASDTYAYYTVLEGVLILGLGIAFVPCLTYCQTGTCTAGEGGPNIYMVGTGIA